MSLQGKLDRLDELAKTFGKTLQRIEEKRIAMMKVRRVDPRVNASIDVGDLRRRSRTFYSSRPMSAAVNQSLIVKDASYQFYHDQRRKSMQSQMYMETVRQQQQTAAASKFYTFSSNIVGIRTEFPLSCGVGGRPRSAVPMRRSRQGAVRPAQDRAHVTDESGTVVFENVPINDYVVRVEGSRSYLPSEKRLDLIAEKTVQPMFTVYVELKPQTSSFLEARVADSEGRPILDADVTAMLLGLTEKADIDRIFIPPEA